MTRIALEVRPMIDMLSRMEIYQEERRPVEEHPHPMALLTAAERQLSRIEHRTDSRRRRPSVAMKRRSMEMDMDIP
jgi:hypothetical protein